MADRDYVVSEDQMRSLERCVESIAEAHEAITATAPEDGTRLEQIRSANMRTSQLLSEIRGVPPASMLGTRRPPRPSKELAKRFKKEGKLY